MTKKTYRKGAKISLPISKQIDINFRDYSLYVLEKRGIPNFYDALTPVQRFILKNTPKTLLKTASVIGRVMSANYHHGDASISSAINNITTTHGNSENMLEGSGFFGNSVTKDAAAPRYTSVKINKKFDNEITKYDFLNSTDEDLQWNPFYLDVPIGLTNTIVGIAVGYASRILPRKIEDVKDYLDGKRKTLTPKFQNFKGKVYKYNPKNKTSNKPSWLIEGISEINEKGRSVHITEIPPILNYKSFLRKIIKIIESDEYENKVKFINKTRDSVDILVYYKGRNKKDFKEFANKIVNTTKLIVTENLVFIKDGMVLEYDNITDYLDDYQYRISELNVKNALHYLEIDKSELKFQEAKLKYLEFMIEKKRSEKEITTFFSKFKKDISNRLDKISLRKLSKEEIKRTVDKIKELKENVKILKKEHKKYEGIFKKLEDPTLKLGVKNKSNTISLFDLSEDELLEEDGIEFFTGMDDEDEEYDL